VKVKSRHVEGLSSPSAISFLGLEFQVAPGRVVALTPSMPYVLVRGGMRNVDVAIWRGYHSKGCNYPATPAYWIPPRHFCSFAYPTMASSIFKAVRPGP
jgi:hypothetical protein